MGYLSKKTKILLFENALECTSGRHVGAFYWVNMHQIMRDILRGALMESLYIRIFSWKYFCCFFFSFFFERHNGPAPARPLQDGRFWKRSETRKRILRVAQKTQIKSALQELLESLPDRMWKETKRSKCAETEDTENPVSEYVCL